MTTQTKSPGIVLDYVKTIGIVNNGFSGRGFANPYDLAVDGDGRIFVLNRCDPLRAAAIRIGICNLDEDYLGEFGRGYGDGDGQFIWAVAMALDSQGRLHITDEHNHRVTTYDTSGSATGEYLSHWGKAGAGDGELNGPAGIAIDSSDNVFVVDQHNSRVQKFTSEGKFIANWGSFGSGEGQFNLPWGAAVDGNDNVYIADWRNDRIQKFSPDGRFLMKFGSSGDGEGQFNRPTGLAVDKEGIIYVADWLNNRLQVFDADGSFITLKTGDATVSKWGKDKLDANAEMWGERDRAQGMDREKDFWAPSSVTVDDDNVIYVCEGPRNRIQVYQKQSPSFAGPRL